MLIAALVAMSAVGSLEASAPRAADAAIASSPMQQARPVIMRSKPRVHEITIEVELYASASTVPGFSNDNAV